jgi:endonuclease/exonuclease/phosphatase (EEP) superfamily protein YafD
MLLGAWALAYFLLGDRWWWLFALSSVAICLFVPVPIILAIGLVARRRDLVITSAAFLLLCAYLYGGALLPRPRSASAAGPTLTVMSFNMYGFNEHPEAVVAALRASEADVIGLQELSVGRPVQPNRPVGWPLRPPTSDRDTGAGTIRIRDS